MGKEVDGDILIATDPDCDRVACMVKNKEGEYVFLNGNQTGALLVNYILSSRSRKNTIPQNGVIVKSIVTGDLSRRISEKYNVETIETLTGFKHICSKANEFDITKEHTFIFGFEESIGYVYGTMVRDKDGVISSMLISEMAAYYKKEGKTLLDVLEELYREFGYYKEKLISIVLEGLECKERFESIMKEIRENPITQIGDKKLIMTMDYLNGEIKDLEKGIVEETHMPKSNVLKYKFDDGSWYAIRPSGTEPKIKIYIYSTGKSENHSNENISLIERKIMDRIKK